jgi:hypothetical protein
MFTVGTVQWAVHLESGAALFALASLDRLLTRTSGGEIVRDVPGWRLTSSVFSAMAGLHAQVERAAARRIVVSRQRGFEVVEGDSHEHRDTSETVYCEGAVVFEPANDARGAGATLLRALRDPDSEIVADLQLDRGMHPPHAVGRDPRIALPVSHGWFGGRAHAQDRVMCAC